MRVGSACEPDSRLEMTAHLENFHGVRRLSQALPNTHPEGRILQAGLAERISNPRMGIVTVLRPDYRLRFPADRRCPNQLPDRRDRKKSLRAGKEIRLEDA
jgi:hypothetical protein